MAEDAIDAVRQAELLSALADGVLEGEELAQALDLAATQRGRSGLGRFISSWATCCAHPSSRRMAAARSP